MLALFIPGASPLKVADEQQEQQQQIRVVPVVNEGMVGKRTIEDEGEQQEQHKKSLFGKKVCLL